MNNCHTMPGNGPKSKDDPLQIVATSQYDYLFKSERLNAEMKESDFLLRCYSATEVSTNPNNSAKTTTSFKRLRPCFSGLCFSFGRRCASAERLHDGMDAEDALRFYGDLREMISRLKLHRDPSIESQLSTLSTSDSSSASNMSLDSQKSKLSCHDRLMNPCNPDTKQNIRKVVRFADSLGLELSTIFYIPAEGDSSKGGGRMACKSSVSGHSSSAQVRNLALTPSLYIGKQSQIYAVSSDIASKQFQMFSSRDRTGNMTPTFQMPKFLSNFEKQSYILKVMLEEATNVDLNIRGTIRVIELGNVDKKVFIRLSQDGWQTFEDYHANYVPKSSDGCKCKFAFSIYYAANDHYSKVPFDTKKPTARKDIGLEFAICYQTAGREYWDNHYCENYKFLWPYSLSNKQ